MNFDFLGEPTEPEPAQQAADALQFLGTPPVPPVPVPVPLLAPGPVGAVPGPGPGPTEPEPARERAPLTQKEYQTGVKRLELQLIYLDADYSAAQMGLINSGPADYINNAKVSIPIFRKRLLSNKQQVEELKKELDEAFFIRRFSISKQLSHATANQTKLQLEFDESVFISKFCDRDLALKISQKVTIARDKHIAKIDLYKQQWLDRSDNSNIEFISDEDKIHARLEYYKKKDKKSGTGGSESGGGTGTGSGGDGHHPPPDRPRG